MTYDQVSVYCPYNVLPNVFPHTLFLLSYTPTIITESKWDLQKFISLSFLSANSLAKLKAQAQQEQSGSSQDTKSFQEVLKERKEKRDYKRRRQKYRAKNVHITRRKTSEVRITTIVTVLHVV